MYFNAEWRGKASACRSRIADLAVELLQVDQMTIPNADKAIIAPQKLRDYLLNPAHRRGSAKARLLLSCGYRADAWQVLEADLRTQHLTTDLAVAKDNMYGRRFEILAPLATPSGRRINFQSIWQIDDGTEVPRLITMYPR
jgi:hypothetical protein